MTTSAKHITTKPCRRPIHHRFYYANIIIHKTNPFPRRRTISPACIAYLHMAPTPQQTTSRSPHRGWLVQFHYRAKMRRHRMRAENIS